MRSFATYSRAATARYPLSNSNWQRAIPTCASVLRSLRVARWLLRWGECSSSASAARLSLSSAKSEQCEWSEDLNHIWVIWWVLMWSPKRPRKWSVADELRVKVSHYCNVLVQYTVLELLWISLGPIIQLFACIEHWCLHFSQVLHNKQIQYQTAYDWTH